MSLPRWSLVVVVVVAGVACAPAPTLHRDAVAFGIPSSGWLLRGRALPDRGDGFERARPGEDTRFGLPRLVEALARATAAVAARHPGTVPLRIGDLSSPAGGAHPRHRSHRNGRDADVLFYVTDRRGVSVTPRGWVSFNRFGVSVDSRESDDAVVMFDVARNWHLVRTLLADDAAHVQWIFCSAGVKARLLEYAADVEHDPTILWRAQWVLHQPSRGNPHADHFHVRVACTAAERSLGCEENGPVWPWMHAAEKPDRVDPQGDDAILAWLLDD